ncbi:hypothetical protein [Chengkuizengella axinellae]|uniref:Uncharacterized protein n=1 Tax=Chengkuizengella axinellae TaxID=3064388 RepID=A0ABT9IVB6_9BACL|nr:hypothetical protein [Chengkuizengella sp. 2205SS18-9]MDP5273002.1 hypothetical protein [Chengkuizengella sp. 2205SS18-9]
MDADIKNISKTNAQKVMLVCLKTIFLINLLIYSMFILIIMATASEYASHTVILTYVEFNPSEELIKFSIHSFIYLILFYLFFNIQKEFTYKFISSVILFLLHLLWLYFSLWGIGFRSDLAFIEVVIMTYGFFILNLIAVTICVINIVKYFKMFKEWF